MCNRFKEVFCSWNMHYSNKSLQSLNCDTLNQQLLETTFIYYNRVIFCTSLVLTIIKLVLYWCYHKRRVHHSDDVGDSTTVYVGGDGVGSSYLVSNILSVLTFIVGAFCSS